jgi:hypothetical protein
METINIIEPDLNGIEKIFVDPSKQLFKEFNFVKAEQFDGQSSTFLALFICRPFDIKHVIEKIPNKIFLYMQQGIVKPIIFQTTEAWDLFDTFAWEKNKFNITPDFGEIKYSTMVRHFTGRGVPEENLTWVVPNNIHERQISFLEQRGYKIKATFIQYCYFIEIMKLVANKIDIQEKKFVKHYNCLCRGNLKNHRYGIIYNLWNTRLLDKGNVSCEQYEEIVESKNSNWVDDAITSEEFMQNFKSWHQNKKKFTNMLPLSFDNKVNQHWEIDQYNEKNIFDNAFLWISSETKIHNDGIHITEKTWKAIAHGSPFCINGNVGSLSYLHDMGYKSFDKFWDESYDNYDGYDRIQMITKIIETICSKSLEEINSMYAQMIPILKHNQKTLKENQQHINLLNYMTGQNGHNK